MARNWYPMVMAVFPGVDVLVSPGPSLEDRTRVDPSSPISGRRIGTRMGTRSEEPTKGRTRRHRSTMLCQASEGSGNTAVGGGLSVQKLPIHENEYIKCL